MTRTSFPTSALYVRLPTAEADRLDRAARALGVPKKVLVTRLISSLMDPNSDQSKGGPGEPATQRGRADLAADAMPMGAYSFHPYELPEVLTAEQAGQLLQLPEQVVVQLAEAGKLPGRMLGDTWRFSRAGLVAWLSCGAAPEG